MIRQISGRGADHAAVGKLLSDAAGSVASAMAFEEGLYEGADLRVGALSGGRRRGVVKAAARLAEDRAPGGCWRRFAA
ncbi:MAG: hypothetical protein M3463_09525 [Verrucomicrobiota bacterium]|nr:hypothetical protein [Verrucomicrobiota bacterium]